MNSVLTFQTSQQTTDAESTDMSAVVRRSGSEQGVANRWRVHDLERSTGPTQHDSGADESGQEQYPRGPCQPQRSEEGQHHDHEVDRFSRMNTQRAGARDSLMPYSKANAPQMNQSSAKIVSSTPDGRSQRIGRAREERRRRPGRTWARPSAGRNDREHPLIGASAKSAPTRPSFRAGSRTRSATSIGSGRPSRWQLG